LGQLKLVPHILPLDGLRGAAFLNVVALHLGVWKYGGIGVDVFFVLSGYLITSILRRARGDPKGFATFYIKRARRILPPMALTVVFCAVCFDFEWPTLWPYYLLLAGNFATAYHDDLTGPLNPLWSLGIEEQFYLIWPLLALRLSRTALLSVVGVVLALSPLLRLYAGLANASTWAICALPWLHLDGIAAGAGLALLLENPGWTDVMRRWNPFYFAVSTVGVLLTFRGFGQELSATMFLYSFSAGVGVTCLVGAKYIEAGWLEKILTSSAARFFAKISYTGYLIHVPMIYLARRILGDYAEAHSRQAALLSFPFSIVFAYASWRLLEEPIIRGRWPGLIRPCYQPTA
jgi:peptidoglycan/LPS O-acetylase OafA/YrhL